MHEWGVTDRLEIHDVLVAYATGIDRRDWDLLRRCFTDDCRADYGDIGQWHDGDAITAWMREVHTPLGHTQHRITNVTVEPTATGARTRSYVEAIVLGPDNSSGVRANGYYDDDFVRVDGHWRIAHRQFTQILLRPV